MNRREFRGYRQELDIALHKLLAERPPGSLDEHAVPSYTHPNILMSRIFWERIHLVINELEKKPPRLALDFGCGIGVLFPALLTLKAKVVAYDVDLNAVKRIAERRGWNCIEWVYGADGLQALGSGSFDTIICLDVLEHVESLRNITREFARLVSPRGRIIISGPTESRWSRLGRWLAASRVMAMFGTSTMWSGMPRSSLI